MDTEPTTLYRAFDKDGQLIYVGIARNWARRWDQHRSRSHWFDEVVRLEFETLPTRNAAELAERKAIRSERPVYNVQHAADLAPLNRDLCPALDHDLEYGEVMASRRDGDAWQYVYRCSHGHVWRTWFR